MKFLAGKTHFSHRYNLRRSVNEQINWEGKGENIAMARTRSAGGRSASCCDRQEREKMCLEWIFTFQFNIYWAPKLGARHCAGYWVFTSLHDKSYTTKELRFWERREICSQTISKQGIMWQIQSRYKLHATEDRWVWHEFHLAEHRNCHRGSNIWSRMWKVRVFFPFSLCFDVFLIWKGKLISLRKLNLSILHSNNFRDSMWDDSLDMLLLTEKVRAT